MVSYAHDRDNAPSLQEVCGVMSRQSGVLVLSCMMWTTAASGAKRSPVFSFEHDAPRIVSVVSAKARVNGEEVSLGVSLDFWVGRNWRFCADRAGRRRGRWTFEGYARTAARGVGRVQVGRFCGSAKRHRAAKFIQQLIDLWRIWRACAKRFHLSDFH